MSGKGKKLSLSERFGAVQQRKAKQTKKVQTKERTATAAGRSKDARNAAVNARRGVASAQKPKQQQQQQQKKAKQDNKAKRTTAQQAKARSTAAKQGGKPKATKATKARKQAKPEQPAVSKEALDMELDTYMSQRT
eukprot:TRINITY_DN2394_c0_g1_i1.p1 TRINITY_DN2394_c0_g1~~TRINITY_DN2394_c0_g1_i1.p1  ORF type:complete len:145 (+),score=45.26 TRINITY_DN2394_c0_g1_i1:29-436(+)